MSQSRGLQSVQKKTKELHLFMHLFNFYLTTEVCWDWNLSLRINIHRKRKSKERRTRQWLHASWSFLAWPGNRSRALISALRSEARGGISEEDTWDQPLWNRADTPLYRKWWDAAADQTALTLHHNIPAVLNQRGQTNNKTNSRISSCSFYLFSDSRSS